MKDHEDEPLGEPSDDERREAEALARALEGQPSERWAPPEALETAALLRYAHGAGQLEPGRQEALRARLGAQQAPPVSQPRRTRWRWTALSVAAAACAVALFAGSQFAMRASQSPPALAWPAAPPSLLALQAEAARGQAHSLARLDIEMRAYRQTVFARLAAGGRTP